MLCKFSSESHLYLHHSIPIISNCTNFVTIAKYKQIIFLAVALSRWKNIQSYLLWFVNNNTVHWDLFPEQWLAASYTSIILISLVNFIKRAPVSELTWRPAMCILLKQLNFSSVKYKPKFLISQALWNKKNWLRNILESSYLFIQHRQYKGCTFQPSVHFCTQKIMTTRCRSPITTPSQKERSGLFSHNLHGQPNGRQLVYYWFVLVPLTYGK